ncbi:inosine/xanthosine triphosphatase [Methanothermobacter tenebrarum]|uniref:Probable inosine/xanthosine triphosphatase n=1 Tax=Methanothermobacter tenebrarum TaxID=680118 RepID=A0A328PIY5_9EURY|nr:inosine/xanthosine triphosphatase [Methanothermobacter tenebrarum]NPV64222.1 inosine/xanthosine triphosphatase [Methanobacteriaceae archaeon]RAO79835.1 inosine/xanthosine triphosphatase [Methanothermobacter tenebrarum]
MKVKVGSQNPVKIKATKNVLEKIYTKVQVEGVKVDPGVPSQPIGLEQTIKGAINRARRAYQDCDLSIGIESGLLEAPYTLTGYIDLQWCATYNGKTITLGVSAGFEYPPKVIKEVLEGGKEVGDIMDKITGIQNLGEKTGAIYHLTKGLLDRTENTEQCILMAMIPRLNPKLYKIG